MFITKKRHDREIEHRDDEISRLRGARLMDAETIRQHEAEIARLRPLAEKHQAKLDRDRSRDRRKPAAKPTAKKGAGRG